jgi:choice-of-anchor C domain-containing protein
MTSLHQHASSVHRWQIIQFALAVAAIVAVFATQTRGADLVTNGGFESPFINGDFATYHGVDATSLSGWVVDQVGTSIDHDGGLWQDAEGLQSIDMNGTEAGSIYQDLATTPAQQYTIRFALAGNPFGIDNKRLEVLWDGAQIADLTFVQDGYGTDNMGWTYHEFVTTAGDNSTRLTFNSLTGAMPSLAGIQSWYGPAIDDVSVTPVPEPSLLVLTLAGSLLVPVVRRRRGQ